MTLRLSSAATTTTQSSTPSATVITSMTIDGYLKEITGDASLSPTQKTVCLKTLSVVLTNLIDPTKGASSDSATGLKYRTLKLDNPKLGARLFCSGTVRRLLSDPSLVGMVARSAANNNNNNLLIMEEAPSRAIADKIGLTVLPAVSTAHKSMAARATQPTTATTQTATTTTAATPVVPEKLSEKQKARRLLEEKRRLGREQDKAYRRETRAKIAADKHVRKTDENWKPSVSAAADKTGTGLLTFRDRHGE